MGIYTKVADPVLLRQNEEMAATLAQIKEAIGLEVTTGEDETVTVSATKIEAVKADLEVVAEAVSTGEAIEIAEDGTITAVDKDTIKEATPLEGSL